MPVIEVRNLTKVYTIGEIKVHALRRVSLSVEPGEFLAVTGPSGSGKSTFMHIAGCLDRPSSGTYILDGKDVSKTSKDELARVRNEKIGFVFQGFNLLSRTTALDNVELPLLYNSNGAKKLRGKERHDRAMKVLEAVNLGSRFHHMFRCRALVTSPARARQRVTKLSASRTSCWIKGRKLSAFLPGDAISGSGAAAGVPPSSSIALSSHARCTSSRARMY